MHITLCMHNHMYSVCVYNHNYFINYILFYIKKIFFNYKFIKKHFIIKVKIQ